MKFRLEPFSFVLNFQPGAGRTKETKIDQLKGFLRYPHYLNTEGGFSPYPIFPFQICETRNFGAFLVKSVQYLIHFFNVRIIYLH